VHDFLARVQARLGRARHQVVSGNTIGQAVDIARLMCPLRYDLWVRIEFIRLLRDESKLYSGDLAEFLDRPESRAYYRWFKEVACARFHPDIYRDDRLVQPVFLRRVQETSKLWDSIQRTGYDWSSRIRLRSGRTVQQVNNKRIDSANFLGDGCHRLSCLYVMGQTQLDPSQYEVEVAPVYQPLDNTAILIKSLPLDRIRYLRFISRYYCHGLELDSPDEIRARVAEKRPSLLSELESVFAFDLPILATA
jgi:hypothetical protein